MTRTEKNKPYYYVISPHTASKRAISAERYMLRESGDWRGYLAMVNSGAIETTPFLHGMVNYYDDALTSFKKIEPVNDGLLIALSVWGEDYLHRFLNYCLPSLLEKKNKAALLSRTPTIFIHTDTHGRNEICGSAILKQFIESGFKIQVMMLNETLLDMIPGNQSSKYWHLGLTQSLHVQYAKALGMEYHLLMPDVVYSAGFFERLIGLNKPVITHSSIPTDSFTMEGALDEYKNGFELDIPPPKMMALSLRHMHDRMKPYLVNQSKKFPKGHVLVFEGKDTVHLMSPHQTIAWMSKEAVAASPDRFFFTLDSEIEKIIQGFPVYSPNRDDALVMIEMSGKIDSPARGETSSTEEFCKRFLQQIPEQGLRGLFSRGMEMPVERSMLGDRWYMDEAEILAMRREAGVMLCSS